jgi:hypothetical protein
VVDLVAGEEVPWEGQHGKCGGVTGGVLEGMTGMYNYGYRDYKAGRFTTEDPVRDGNNWYAYMNSKGSNDGVIMSIPRTAIPVAFLHTHAAYDSRYESNVFSSTDKKMATTHGIPFYLASTDSSLQAYDPIAGIPLPINTNMSSDKHGPFPKNNIHLLFSTYNANPTISGLQNFVDHGINFVYRIFGDLIKSLFSSGGKKVND